MQRRYCYEWNIHSLWISILGCIRLPFNLVCIGNPNGSRWKILCFRALLSVRLILSCTVTPFIKIILKRLNNFTGSYCIYFHNLLHGCLNVWTAILRDLDGICEGTRSKSATNKNHWNRARGSTRHRGVMRAPPSKTRFIHRTVDAHLRNDALTCE